MAHSSHPPGRQAAISAILDVFHAHHHFLVTSHSRPDADAIGSSLGAMYLLQAMGKEVVVAFADPIPRTFAGLPGAERIVHSLPAISAEVALILECDSIKRTGFDHLAAPISINIDHHLSGTNYATVNWIEPSAAAVGALLYELAVAADVPISPEFATCLYAGLLTDTVCFTIPSVNAQTFELAHQLVRLGADAAAVADSIYHSVRPARLRVLGTALLHLRVQGPIAWSAVTLDEIEAAHAEVEDCEDIVNYVIGIQGVCAGAFLRELSSNRFRVSLRSKDGVDVAAVAETLGGGGHQNASGCTLEGSLSALAERLTRLLHDACAASSASTANSTNSTSAAAAEGRAWPSLKGQQA